MKNNDLKPYGTYLNMLAHKYDKGQVFEDFLQIIVCCLQMGRAEELYFKTIKKYSRDELQYFSLAFASLVDEMTRKELQDPFYGWFEQNLLNAGSGQFFTPRPVADLLAQLEYILLLIKPIRRIMINAYTTLVVVVVGLFWLVREKTVIVILLQRISLILVV